MDPSTVPSWPPRTVADLMRRDVYTVEPDDRVRDAVGLLLDHDISGLPVVDGGGRVLGVLSVTDLLWHADEVTATARRTPGGGHPPWAPLGDRPVRDLMTPDFFSVAPGDSIDDLLRFLVRRGLHRALVMDGHRLVGVVSFTDLLPLVAGRGDPRGSGGDTA